MKIGLFIDSFYPMVDGVINVVDNYAKELLKYGEVTVFCPLLEKNKITGKPYKIVQCKSLTIKGIDYALPLPTLDENFIKALNKSNLDIVHLHSPCTIGLIGRNYAKQRNLPLIATLHSQFKQDFEKFVNGKPLDIAISCIMKIFNSCDICYAVNEKMREVFISQYGLTTTCTVRKNATNHLPVENLELACNEINTTYNVSPDQSVYLFVGRINFLKNVHFIVQSLKILKTKGRSFKMIFVGCGQDEIALNQLIVQLSLENDVIMAGKITDVKHLEKLYCRAKLFLFPSLYDANSLVQIEASCQKTPTLFLKGAITASEIIDNVNGFLSPDSPEEYAKRIIEIEDDPILYEKVCNGAKRDLYLNWNQAIYKTYQDYLNLQQQKMHTFKNKGQKSFQKEI